MSHGGWYLDNQIYNNKFTSVSLHYNTVLRAVDPLNTKTNIKDGVCLNADLAVLETEKKSFSQNYKKLEWRRLGGDTIKFLDPLGNRLGIAVGDEDNQPYDEEGYSMKPLLSSIMQDDLNVSITNEYTDYGSDPLGSLWNTYKTTIPTSRFMSKIFTLMANKQDGMSDEDKAKVNDTWMGRLLMSMVNVNSKSSGPLTAFKKYENANLMVQGNRFTFYNGTGISFGTLGMKVTIFPKWDGEKFKTVNAQLDEIFPYVVGNIEPVDLETVENFMTSIRDFLKPSEKGKGDITLESGFKQLVGEYMRFQMPPGCYEPDIKHLDTINKGTLKLKIGPYYSLSDLVIRDMSLNYSKYMVKNPVAGKNNGTEKSTIFGSYEEDYEFSPLFCEVNLMLQPVSKFTSDRLKQFVSGYWRRSDLKYMNKVVKDNIKKEIDEQVTRYSSDKSVKDLRNDIKKTISKQQNVISTSEKNEEDRKKEVAENERIIREKFNSMSQEDRDKILDELVDAASPYVDKETLNKLREMTDLGENLSGSGDLISAVASTCPPGTDALGYLESIKTGTLNTELNKIGQEIYINQELLTNGLATREHVLSNIEYTNRQEELRCLQDENKENIVSALNSAADKLATTDENGTTTRFKYEKYEGAEGYKVIEEKIYKDGEVEIDVKEFKGDFIELAKANITKLQEDPENQSTLQAALREDVKLNSQIANLEAEKKYSENWQKKTIAEIEADPNAEIYANEYIKAIKAIPEDKRKDDEYIDSVLNSILDPIEGDNRNDQIAAIQKILKDNTSKVESLNTELQAAANSQKVRALTSAIDNGLITQETLKAKGFVNNSGNFTEALTKISNQELYNIIENEKNTKTIKSWDETSKREWETKFEAFSKDKTFGEEATNIITKGIETGKETLENAKTLEKFLDTYGIRESAGLTVDSSSSVSSDNDVKFNISYSDNTIFGEQNISNPDTSTGHIING